MCGICISWTVICATLQSMHASKCIPCILYTILMVFKLIGILICCRESTNVNKRDTVLHTNENQTHTHNWAIDCRQPSQRLKSITRRQFQIMFVTLILTLSQHIRSREKKRFDGILKCWIDTKIKWNAITNRQEMDCVVGCFENLKLQFKRMHECIDVIMCSCA